ncbi:hypothetical protein F5Y18DRAFT_371644 [Xylariaceae sp. FL1019]|nr:hypothetical protein F5Y18DRAFT_371644 [Xylariaceae sp. FL1019]
MDSTKKFHNKTRHGCAHCKRRRVRCDLRLPVCSNCWKRDETCTFQFQEGALPTQHDFTSRHRSIDSRGVSIRPCIAHRAVCETPAAADVQSNSHYSKVFDVRMLRQPHNPLLGDGMSTVLMEHYVAWTSFELLLLVDLDLTWRLETIRAASAHPFLRHSLMALSGLHLCHHNIANTSVYYRAACYHNIKASSLFRETVADLRTGDWVEIGNFIINSVIFDFDVSFLSQTHDSSSPPISPRSILHVMRGPRILRQHARRLMFVEPSAKFLASRKRRHQFPPDPEIMAAIEKLELLCSENGGNAHVNLVRLSAVQGLRRWAIAVLCQPQLWDHFLSWPEAVSEEYILMLDNKDPIANLTFVYWCAIMKRAPDKYYFAGRMKIVAEMAMKNLDFHLDDYLEWPRREFETGPGFLFGWMVQS